MRKSILLILMASLIVANCGARKRAAIDAAAAAGIDGATNPLIPQKRRGALAREEKPDLSVPITTVTELKVEPTTSGAVVYATGVAARQGAFRARLVPDNPELIPTDGVLSFTFRVIYPRDATPMGSEFSRTLHEAYSINTDQLAQVRVIRVVAETNSRETRRR